MIPDRLADLRFERAVERLHQLGPRAVAELLAEIGADRMIMTLIEQKVGLYAALSPEAIAVTAGDRFPPRPLMAVAGGRS